MKPKLTIGMAHYDDYDGVYFTIQNLRLNHGANSPDVEIIVVDNNPSSPMGQAVERLCKMLKGVRYIPYTDAVGTTNSRNHIFEVAEAPVVVVMDCHVMPRWPNFCENVIDYFKDGTDNLIQGPLFLDSLDMCYTHFDPVWRSEMFGIWGSARRFPNGEIVSVHVENNVTNSFVMSGHDPNKIDIRNWREMPLIGMSPDDETVEIPSQGLGLFMAKKESWLGFNKDFRGFGGEEGYIHTKYWKAGRKCLSVPKFGWIHRFDRPNGIKYPLTLTNKVRNYVLGHLELGLPIQDIKHHFVDKGRFTQASWDALVLDPLNYTEETPKAPEINSKSFKNLQEVFDWEGLKNRPHTNIIPNLIELAKEPGQTIIDLSNSRETTVALLYGMDRSNWLRTYTHDPHFILDAARRNTTGKRFDLRPLGHPEYPTNSITSINDLSCDTFVVSTLDNGEDAVKLLEAVKDKVRRRVAILNTKAFGLVGVNQKPGFRDAVTLWLKDNKDWFIAEHTQNGLGMTILSKDEADKPATKVVAWPPGYGVGTALKSMLSKIGIQSTPTCSCNYRASEMDRLGYDWCINNRETIIGWLKEEADKRKLPFSKTAVLGVLYVAERMGLRQIRRNECT